MKRDELGLITFSRGAHVGIVKPADGFESRVELTPVAFFDMLALHTASDSKDGPYISRPMGGDGSRSDANALPWSVIGFDLDKLDGATEFEQLQEWCATQGLDCQLTSTYSHASEKPRARLWVRCSRDYDAAEHSFLHRAFTNPKVFPFKVDPALLKPSQPIYLPRCPADRLGEAFSQRYEGKQLHVDALLAAVQGEMLADAQKRAKGKGQLGKGVRSPGGVIDTFNAHYDLPALLDKHGYKQRGKRYLAPGSKSGNPAVAIYQTGLCSFHHPEHDPLATPRTDSAQPRVLDTFAAFAILEYVDDFKLAFNAAAAWLKEKGLDPADGENEEEDDEDLDPPSPMREEAYIGLGGDLVRLMCGIDGSLSEASPPAMLVQFLITFGCAIGERDFIKISSDRHYSNEFVLVVGSTARARKGMTAGPIRDLFAKARPNFISRVFSSVGSGQGITFAVRDRREEQVNNVDKKTGAVTVETKVVDKGEPDKRLLINTGEFQGVIASMVRPDSSVTSVLRDAWDHKPLGSLTRNDGKGSDRCARPHISVAAHMTRSELLAKLPSTENTNGFLNRFLLIYQPASKTLHALGGTRTEGAEWEALAQRLRHTINLFGYRPDHLGELEAKLTPEAEAEYTQRIYPKLRNPLVDARVAPIVARADAHCLRLALIYALVDLDASQNSTMGGAPIQLAHLRAAEAVVDYAIESAAFLFGNKLSRQKRTLQALIEANGAPLPWIEARRGMGLRSAEEFNTLVTHLEELGYVRIVKIERAGRARRLLTWIEQATGSEG